LSKLLQQNKHFYHLGYSSADFDGTLTELTEGNHHLVSIFHSEAFDNRRCAFLINPDGHLLELVEMARDAEEERDGEAKSETAHRGAAVDPGETP
jgi:hypothetical protein